MSYNRVMYHKVRINFLLSNCGCRSASRVLRCRLAGLNSMLHIAAHEKLRDSLFVLDKCSLRVHFISPYAPQILGHGFGFRISGCYIRFFFDLKWGCHHMFLKYLFIAGRPLQGQFSCDEYSRPARERGISIESPGPFSSCHHSCF